MRIGQKLLRHYFTLTGLIVILCPLSSSSNFTIPSPTETVSKMRQMEVPTLLKPIYEREKELVTEGFVVTYHSIPDTRTNGALVLYELQAEIAQILYNIKLDMLPRFRKSPFDHWPNVPTLLNDYVTDHSDDWRSIGISASLSLLSETEAPPYSIFKKGYSGSSAPEPETSTLLMNILIELGLDNTLAQRKADTLSKLGMKYFKKVGGSLLQVAIQSEIAPQYIFITRGNYFIEASGDKMMYSLRTGQFKIDDQARVIMHPEVFLDFSQGRLNHYPYHPKAYTRAKEKFRKLVDKELRDPLEKCMQKITCRQQLFPRLIQHNSNTSL